MISINPKPELSISLILFPVKPEKDESLQSWLARKNHLSKGTKVIFNSKDFGVVAVSTVDKEEK